MLIRTDRGIFTISNLEIHTEDLTYHSLKAVPENTKPFELTYIRISEQEIQQALDIAIKRTKGVVSLS